MTPTAAHLESFLGHLDARDARAATELAVDLALAGATLPDLFGRLIGPAQAEVGRRWLQNAYSVADEHAATAIVDVVVAVLSTQVPPTSIGGPRVALTCPEGEWHVLPARLTAEVLTWGGCPTTFLGGSLPAAHLARLAAVEEHPFAATRFASATPPKARRRSQLEHKTLFGIRAAALTGLDAVRQRARHAARTDGSCSAMVTMREKLYAYLELDAYLTSQQIA